MTQPFRLRCGRWIGEEAEMLCEKGTTHSKITEIGGLFMDRSYCKNQDFF